MYVEESSLLQIELQASLLSCGDERTLRPPRAATTKPPLTPKSLRAWTTGPAVRAGGRLEQCIHVAVPEQRGRR